MEIDILGMLLQYGLGGIVALALWIIHQSHQESVKLQQRILTFLEENNHVLREQAVTLQKLSDAIEHLRELICRPPREM
jgi:hypothetical protein